MSGSSSLSAAHDRKDALPLAQAWFMARYEELHSRAAACFSRARPAEHEEHVAETLATAYATAARAAQRGTLSRLTAYWLVVFSVKQVRGGRRCAGTSSRCVLSPRTRRLGRVQVVSLDAPVHKQSESSRLESIGPTLADPRQEDPLEAVRRRLDYPVMLEEASDGARATFDFLAETKSEGRLADLAETLHLSPPRVTQLKHSLRDVFGARGYHGPLGPRPHNDNCTGN